MIIGGQDLKAEAATVDVPIKVETWYVPHDEAERLMKKWRDECEDDCSEPSSPEGLHVEIRAHEDGKLFRKKLFISATSCRSRVSWGGLLNEVEYMTAKRVIELKRDIVYHRFLARGK